MLLIEKVVKLLDDFHFQLYRDHLKFLSVRSYYPLALIDVIERDFAVEQPSEALYFDVYGERNPSEKDLKKLFQLAHYTFNEIGFLSGNYPEYLQHNITRIQHLINQGQLPEANTLAQILVEIAEKVEDYDTLGKVLNILARRAALMDDLRESIKARERIAEVIQYRQDLNKINIFIDSKILRKTTEDDLLGLDQDLHFLQTYHNSSSTSVQLMARINSCYLRHRYRDPGFYTEQNYAEMQALHKDMDRFGYVIMPYLHNLKAKLSFLRLNYSMRQLDSQQVLSEAELILEESETELFWNSFINLPEINSIAIQTSHFVSNYFSSYRPDHMSILPDEVIAKLMTLRQRTKKVLENELLLDRYVIRYINLTTIYAGLLLLGSKEDIKESINTLESTLTFFQQVAFHAYIDPIYTNLIMGSFCLEDYERLEKYYRRYKKSTKGKVVNPENDLALHGFYFAAKWRETQRKQYTRKLEEVIEATQTHAGLNATRKTLVEVIEYFKIPITLATIDGNS